MTQLENEWTWREPIDGQQRSAAEALLNEIADGRRMTAEEGLELLRNGPQQPILDAADRVRQRLHPDGVVTYIIDRNVNYSNVCTCTCAFCAFYVRKGDDGAYVLSHDQIFEKVAETLALGGSGILMQGGLHPDLPLDYYTDLFRSLKERFPDVYLHCLSPTEIYGLMKTTGKSAEAILTELRDAGLDSIPGGGGEILVDELRSRRRSSCTADEWLGISAAAHRLAIPTTATMMFGLGETAEMRIQHLERLRVVQDDTNGFISFIPWTFQPDNTPLGKAIPNRVPVDYYLRLLALARLYLDNIANLQVSWLTQGIDGGRRGLHCGANDLGSIMIEENVISKAGANHTATERLLRNTIEGEGFRAVLRNGGYHRLPERPIPELAERQ
ncbi:MAG: cyclic dehypoxanthinyl futalosine synthase [Planctomycetota bacterium]